MNYTYLVGDLVLAMVLLIICICRADLRKEILFISAIGLFFGLTMHYFFVSYWSPNYIFRAPFLLEDWLYGSVTAGIASSVYKFVANKKLTDGKPKRYWQVPVFIVGIYLTFLIFNVWLGLNAIYVGSAYLLLSGLIVLIARRDLLQNAFWSGVLLILVTTISYAVMFRIDPAFVSAHWNFQNVTGTLIFSIPLEEYLFAFFWGFVASLIYEYIFGLQITTN